MEYFLAGLKWLIERSNQVSTELLLERWVKMTVESTSDTIPRTWTLTQPRCDERYSVCRTGENLFLL